MLTQQADLPMLMLLLMQWLLMLLLQHRQRLVLPYDLKELLELGMEGWRFFDLVRWGTAATEFNAYYNYESPMPYQVVISSKTNYASPAKDYYPVPQQQIDLSNGFIKP